MLRVLISTALVLATNVASTAPPPAADRVHYTDVPAAQVELFEWALDLFDDAGLALPPIDVVGHRNDEACFGRRGMHQFADGRSRIDICTTDARPAEELLVLHEIAHAWDRQSLTDERRHSFLELRGLVEWRNDDPDRWLERGAEHAAEIMAWGLIDRPVRVARLDANSCADLRAGYQTLTGAEPLHGHTDACRIDDT